VTRVEQDADGVNVDYVGRASCSGSGPAARSWPSRSASRPTSSGDAEERRQLISQIRYADYVVHQVFTSRDLYTKCYDTWFTDRASRT
jgi:hypothetical protein